MTTTQFRRWMRENKYTIPRLAGDLEISQRQISYYRSGKWPVPRVVELALRALALPSHQHL